MVWKHHIETIFFEVLHGLLATLPSLTWSKVDLPQADGCHVARLMLFPELKPTTITFKYIHCFTTWKDSRAKNLCLKTVDTPWSMSSMFKTISWHLINIPKTWLKSHVFAEATSKFGSQQRYLPGFFSLGLGLIRPNRSNPKIFPPEAWTLAKRSTARAKANMAMAITPKDLEGQNVFFFFAQKKVHLWTLKNHLLYTKKLSEAKSQEES